MQLEWRDSRGLDGEGDTGWGEAGQRKPLSPHLSMLDFVSAILLRLATRNPQAPPRCPLFMKLPMARTTSSICFRLLLRVSSREASRMAGRRETAQDAAQPEPGQQGSWLLRRIMEEATFSTLG